MQEMIIIEEELYLELYFFSDSEMAIKIALDVVCHKNNVEYNIEKIKIDLNKGYWVLLYLGGREFELMKTMEEFLHSGICINHKNMPF